MSFWFLLESNSIAPSATASDYARHGHFSSHAACEMRGNEASRPTWHGRFCQNRYNRRGGLKAFATGGRVGHRIIMYFGLALALLVGLFTLWGGLSLGGLTRLGIPEILKYWSIPLLIALGLTFFSVLAKRKPPTKRCSSAAAVAAGVFVLGGYAVLFMETTGVLRLATVSTSAILVGVGYGLLSLVWQHRLSSLAFDDVVKTLLFALVIQSAGYLLLFALLQDRTWMVFPFLVALAVVFCLITLRLPKSNEDRRTNSKRRKGALKSAVAELSDPLLCVCAIAFAVALTRAITLDGIERTDAINLIAQRLYHSRRARPLRHMVRVGRRSRAVQKAEHSRTLPSVLPDHRHGALGALDRGQFAGAFGCDLGVRAVHICFGVHHVNQHLRSSRT